MSAAQPVFRLSDPCDCVRWTAWGGSGNANLLFTSAGVIIFEDEDEGRAAFFFLQSSISHLDVQLLFLSRDQFAAEQAFGLRRDAQAIEPRLDQEKLA